MLTRDEMTTLAIDLGGDDAGAAWLLLSDDPSRPAKSVRLTSRKIGRRDTVGRGDRHRSEGLLPGDDRSRESTPIANCIRAESITNCLAACRSVDSAMVAALLASLSDGIVSQGHDGAEIGMRDVAASLGVSAMSVSRRFAKMREACRE